MNTELELNEGVSETPKNTDVVETIPEEEVDKIAHMALVIRDNSYEGRLTNAEDFLEEPLSMEVEEILTMIEELEERVEFKDICISKSEETIFLFSENYITKNYAKMMIMVEEKDLLKLVAETVREESKIYPRPTDSRLFKCSPFNLTKDLFEQVLEQIKKNERYKDIQETRASNNALYLYSDMYMKKAHAASLTEWIEVESEQNP